MISIRNLNKYYNRHKSNENHVINNLSIDLPDKGLITFFGPSGCGKTTLLNVIGGLDTFDSGEIVFFNQSFRKYIPRKMDELRNIIIGYIFQNYNLVDNKNVYENVKMPLEILGVRDQEEIKRRVDYALNAVGLDKYRRRNVLALSGGQRQRVAIARALVKNPKVIIADEPTGNLDSNNTFDVMNIIKKISREKLVILVSHEKDLVEFYSDRIIELKDGRICGDRTNDYSGDLTHRDERKIYLKDYSLQEVDDSNLKLNIYEKEEVKSELNFDVVIKNGEIYLRNNTGRKIHIVGEESEITFLDSKEEDFKKELKEKDTDFDLSILGETPTNSKKRGFIPLHKSIADGFVKSRRFSKRGAFTYIALIFASIMFAFLLASFAAKFIVDEKTYLKTTKSTIGVEITKREEHLDLDYDDLYTAASKVDGFLGIRGGNIDNTLGFELARFKQNQNIGSYNAYVYPVKSSCSYDLVTGQKATPTEGVVISKWIADDILDSINAQSNGYISYEDLIGVEASMTPNYYYYEEGGSYKNKTFSYKIVGIAKENSYMCVVPDDMYNSIVEDSFKYNDSSTYYIECQDKALMIRSLKDFSYLYDYENDGKREYIKDSIKINLDSIIVTLVMSIAVFIYLALMNRSSMFKKIKDLGVLRTIGAKKGDIYSIFVGESIALTTVTAFIGFTLVSLVIVYFKQKFNLGALQLNIFEVNIFSYLIGVILIYLFNIISSLMPIFFLLNKTPVEIIKKYDI